jgi:predicted DNA-binding transcriptional regulator AlpA
METAFMTLQEVAEYICFQPNTIYRKARKGDIPCHKIACIFP